MIAFRAVDYCTGTPDNPCVMDDFSIDVQLPRPPPKAAGTARSGIAPAAIGIVAGVILLVVAWRF